MIHFYWATIDDLLLFRVNRLIGGNGGNGGNEVRGDIDEKTEEANMDEDAHGKGEREENGGMDQLKNGEIESNTAVKVVTMTNDKRQTKRNETSENDGTGQEQQCR